MKFTPLHYLDSSQEGINAARRLYNGELYASAIYYAGVATECLLRAYKLQEDPQFDSRHDLKILLKTSGIVKFLLKKEQKKFAFLFGEIWACWKNDYRFASSSRLRSEFKRLQLDRGIKGDFLKSNANRVINNAYEIISLGVRRWNLKKS